jgi:hypothetical protein
MALAESDAVIISTDDGHADTGVDVEQAAVAAVGQPDS